MLLIAIACSRQSADTSNAATVSGQETEHRGDTTVMRQGEMTVTITPGPPLPPPDTTLLVPLEADSRLIRRLSRAPILDDDTIHFYSAEDMPSWPFTGQSLSADLESLFAFRYPELRFPHVETQVFVVGQLPLTATVTGYVLRVPGMYSSSELDLWSFDNKTNRLDLVMRLAEHWGDEGYVFNEESWLVRPSSDRVAGLYQRHWHSNEDIETGTVHSRADSLSFAPFVHGTFGALAPVGDSLLRMRFRFADRSRPM